MILVVGGVIMLVVSNVLSRGGYGGGNGGGNQGGNGGGNRGGYGRENTGGNSKFPQLTHNFKDVFLAGMSGKPTLGTATATCWARRGICVDISQCPSLLMDVSVAGCSWGHKVCCKVHAFGTPTVGVFRRYSVPVINNIDELGPSLETIALRNSMLLSSWHTKKTENDEVYLDDIELNK